jgi:hypothetical protein
VFCTFTGATAHSPTHLLTSPRFLPHTSSLPLFTTISPILLPHYLPTTSALLPALFVRCRCLPRSVMIVVTSRLTLRSWCYHSSFVVVLRIPVPPPHVPPRLVSPLCLLPVTSPLFTTFCSCCYRISTFSVSCVLPPALPCTVVPTLFTSFSSVLFDSIGCSLNFVSYCVRSDHRFRCFVRLLFLRSFVAQVSRVARSCSRSPLPFRLVTFVVAATALPPLALPFITFVVVLSACRFYFIYL